MLASWYIRAYNRRPFLTQSATTAFLFGGGDIIAQQVIERKGFEDHNWYRTGRMLVYGGIVAGPILSKWYHFVQHNIKGSTPITALIKKVSADQLLMAPTMLGAFFTTQGLLEGKSIAEIQDKFKKGYIPTIKTTYKFWPAVQFVNFYFVPLQYRIIVMNVVSLGWNANLSMANQRASSNFKLARQMHAF